MRALELACLVSAFVNHNLNLVDFRVVLGLSEEMFEDGYQNLSNIDISFTV